MHYVINEIIVNRKANILVVIPLKRGDNFKPKLLYITLSTCCLKETNNQSQNT